MTDSSTSSPSSSNTKPEPRYHQFCWNQVCQCRVVLQSLCQCLTANKDVQNTRWNHLRFFEIHIQEISTPSTACSHTSAHTDISCQCGLQWNEKNKLKFTQICIMDLAHLSTNPLCSLPFTHYTISPSIGSVWIPTAVPLPLMTGSSKKNHHPHQTPSLSPFRANVIHLQIQVCQGRVVLQHLCQSLTANKSTNPGSALEMSKREGGVIAWKPLLWFAMYHVTMCKA